ncbi:MAG: transporter permease [Thermomicrobiales bacterium]|jgi:branched-chain amino acid transport system permease protein|nr:transporter permease [Thermomicrobiales bacterium]
MDLLQVVISGLLLGGVYALFAAGMNMIFGVLRVINLAHGELMMLGAYTTFWLYALAGVNPLISLPISALLVFALGAVIERGLLERIVGQPLLSSLLLTFGLSTLFMGIALSLWTANYRSVPYLTGSVDLLGLNLSQTRLVAFAIALAVTGLTFAFLRFTTFGKAIRATAQNPEVAQVCGINVGRVRLVTFALGSAMAAVAGSLIAMIFTISPEMGRVFLGRAFAIVVLGGLGSFVGAFLGALVLGVVETVTAYFTDTQLAEGVSYAVLVLVLLLRPSGLFGEKE